MTEPTAWRSRIVGHGEEAPDQLLANPLNWRVHPKYQQDVLRGVLRDVGVVQEVMVNTVTGHLIDGHLRVQLALQDELTTIPVKYVELTLEEELEILATLDPIGTLAIADRAQLQEVLGQVQSEDAAVLALMAQLEDGSGLVHVEFDVTVPPDDAPRIYTDVVNVPQYQVVGERPAVSELYDEEKAESLRKDILAADLEPELRDYLLAATYRHVVFNYRKAAEYYPHASAEVQRLFERSALVIIDFEDAIREGYVRLSETLTGLREADGGA